MSSCEKHPHEHGVALCRRCGGLWCKNCLVFTYGPKKPPFCMSCAMYAGGVRTMSPRPALSKRELKALERQFRAASVTSEVAPLPADVTADMPETPANDWQTPWWEDRQPSSMS